MNFNTKTENFFLTLRGWSFGKSILSGGVTALVDLSLLFISREIFGWGHFWAINVSFAIAILVNFSLQKFWAFSDRDLSLAHKQFLRFFLITMVNFLANIIIMFLLVYILGFWYLGAQVFTIGLLAVMNFILYRRFVFI